MAEGILVDTGPLVAIQSPRDPYHEECKEAFKKLKPPLLTCWPVVTEAAWLLRKHPTGIYRVLAGFQEGLWHALALDDTAAPYLSAFMKRYQDLGAQLADAALVYLAEREKIYKVFTLDRRDFHVYRLDSGAALDLIP